MLRIAICDDELECLEKTRDYVMRWIDETKSPACVNCFTNGDQLISAIHTTTFDIIFLDIIMPMLNGMDTAKEIRNKDRNVKIIFLTSSPEYALESYEIKAYDYILKPFSAARIIDVLKQCTMDSTKEPEHIILKTSCGYQKLYFHNIEFIEAQNKKILICLRDNRMIETAPPLRAFENQLLENSNFFKCHRSYLVYLPNVDHFSTTEIITRSGYRIPIARGYGKAFQEAYFAAMFPD